MGKIADLLQERGQLDQALRIRAQGLNGVTPGGSRSNMARGRRLASSAAKRSGSSWCCRSGAVVEKGLAGTARQE